MRNDIFDIPWINEALQEIYPLATQVSSILIADEQKVKITITILGETYVYTMSFRLYDITPKHMLIEKIVYKFNDMILEHRVRWGKFNDICLYYANKKFKKK